MSQVKLQTNRPVSTCGAEWQSDCWTEPYLPLIPWTLDWQMLCNRPSRCPDVGEMINLELMIGSVLIHSWFMCQCSFLSHGQWINEVRVRETCASSTHTNHMLYNNLAGKYYVNGHVHFLTKSFCFLLREIYKISRNGGNLILLTSQRCFCMN